MWTVVQRMPRGSTSAASALVEHLLDQPVDVLALGQIGRMRVRVAAVGPDLRDDLVEALLRARDQHDARTGGAELDGGRLADAARGAGDEDRAVLHGAPQAAFRARGADGERDGPRPAA